MDIFYVYVYFDPTRELEAFYVGKGHGKRSHCHLTRTDHHPFTHRIQKMAAAHKGRKHTEESKKKMADARSGKPLSVEHKKRISESVTGIRYERKK